MQGLELLGAAVLLLVTVGVGLVAHELTHAVVLHALGVPYDITWFPGCDAAGLLDGGLLGTWATVTPRWIPEGVPARGLRLSALAPLVLTLPFVLVVAGVLPDPLAAGNAFGVVVTVAWLGCALPSPQDFSLFWHADRVVADEGEPRPGDR